MTLKYVIFADNGGLEQQKTPPFFRKTVFCFVYQIISFAAKPPQKKKVFVQYCSGEGNKLLPNNKKIWIPCSNEHGPLFYIIEIMPSTANANSIGKS